MTEESKSAEVVRIHLSLYRTMRLIRECEELLARSHARGLVHGACHTYVGQEAIAAGVCASLRADDVIFSTHRGHGHALAKGLHPRELFAEVYGRAAGCSGGRGGSMHLFKPEIGLMGTSGIVGPSLLQACGGGYTFKLERRDRVSVAFFGDGAVNNGAFHEALNLASIWKLPVVFVCENNQYATEVPFRDASGIPEVGRRAASYGLPGAEIDGNDVLEVHRTARDAVERARGGGGATLIECRTYRTRPHAEGMSDSSYRTREEVEAWKARCPIQRLRKRLIEEAQVAGSDLDAIDREIERLVADSHRFAEESPLPEPATATAHVWREPAIAAPAAREPAASVARREISFVKATVEALDEAMARNERIFVLGEGIGPRGGNFTTTLGLYAKYGAERLRDTPICERGFVGLACGAAMTGSYPVVDFMFVDFLSDAFGEIVNQISKMRYMSSGRLRMPIVLRGCIGIGHSAATHHSGSYHATYAHFPGLRVVLPSTPFDAKGLLTHALRCEEPVLFLEHRELMALAGPVPERSYEIPFGRAALVREGHDCTIVALSLMRHRAERAAEMLAAEGISVEIIDPRTVSPLDTETILESVARTGRLLVVDEAFEPCGVGAEIAARVADRGFDDLDAPIKRLSGAFTPTPYSPTIEKVVVPQVEDIVRAVKEVMEE